MVSIQQKELLYEYLRNSFDDEECEERIKESVFKEWEKFPQALRESWELYLVHKTGTGEMPIKNIYWKQLE